MRKQITVAHQTHNEAYLPFQKRFDEFAPVSIPVHHLDAPAPHGSSYRVNHAQNLVVLALEFRRLGGPQGEM